MEVNSGRAREGKERGGEGGRRRRREGEEKGSENGEQCVSSRE